MRNASQLNSQFDSEFSEFNLPPVLKPRSAEGGYAKRSAEGGYAKRSIELPLIEPLAEPLPEPLGNPAEEKASVQRSEGGYAKRSGEGAGKTKRGKVDRKRGKETPPYPPNSGGNRAKKISETKKPSSAKSDRANAASSSTTEKANVSKSPLAPVERQQKVGGFRGQCRTPQTPPASLKPKFNFKTQLLQPAATQFKRIPKITVPSVKLPEVKLPEVTLPPMPAFLKKQTKPWEWSIVWLWALGAFGGLGIVAFAWMASLPPLPECRTVTRTSPGNDRLYCAQERARSGELADLQAAMALLNGWSEQEPLYDEVQRSIAEWSSLVLIKAREQMAQNDLKGAIDIANQIPKTSSVYPEAQETIDRWQKQWQKGEQAYASAQAAMQAQRWSDASYYVSTLNELQQDYWRVNQADRLAQQIQAEKQGWQALNKARKQAQGKSMSDLVGAIGLVKDITPETYVWQAAQADLKQWGQSLLDLAMRQWQQGDLNGAIAAAQQVPLNVPLPPEVQDLVKFSHASQQVAQTGTNSSWSQLWNLMEGIAAMEQISPVSPLYSQAQTQRQTWEKQFTDGFQLQWADLGAQFGQQTTLNWAIDQAKPLVGQSPITNQAQTLISQWQNQIQILEDQPILRTAETIAARNTIPDLQQAIAYVRQIPADRATFSETQRLTSQWQQQIQTLEDQPIWDEAQNLAKREQYAEAIVVAGRINSNRALYPQAQQAIESWKQAIRSKETEADRKILDRARAFAAKGNLTEAIATAAEIQPGRELYLEAQGAIGQWLRQRDGASSDPAGSDPEESDEAM